MTRTIIAALLGLALGVLAGLPRSWCCDEAAPDAPRRGMAGVADMPPHPQPPAAHTWGVHLDFAHFWSGPCLKL
jgi:hypothetical protein